MLLTVTYIKIELQKSAYIKLSRKYDLLAEYKRRFSKNTNRVHGKSPSMEEKTPIYLSEYTPLIGTSEYIDGYLNEKLSRS